MTLGRSSDADYAKIPTATNTPSRGPDVRLRDPNRLRPRPGELNIALMLLCTAGLDIFQYSENSLINIDISLCEMMLN